MSTIFVKQQLMDFTAATHRPRCATCAQREEHWLRGSHEHMRLRCKPGGFMTTAWAICDQYQPNQTQGKTA